MRTPPCPSGKKEFFNRQDAEQYAEKLKKDFPNDADQYAYACEECPHFHLSAQSPEAHSTVMTHWPFSPEEPQVQTRGKYAHKEDEISTLFKQGKRITEIGMLTGVPYQHVRYILIARGLYQPKSSPDSGPCSPKASAESLESLGQQEAQLQDQLESLQRQQEALRKKKEVLIEAKRLKIETNDSGFIFRKEGNILPLSFDDTASLVLQVVPKLPNAQAFVQRVLELGAEMELAASSEAA
jgi:hypothetical protein